MSNLQFMMLFITVCFNALILLKIAYGNKIDIAVIKKDIHYIKRDSQRIKAFVGMDIYQRENNKHK